MRNRQELENSLDTAIDQMDLAKFDNNLQKLSLIAGRDIEPEDPRMFAARIQKEQKERAHMQFSRKILRVAAVAAIISTMCLSVYAANRWNHFAFLSGERLVTLRTTEEMTEEQARELVNEGHQQSTQAGEEQTLQSHELDTMNFQSAEEAEREMGMRLVLPPAALTMQMESASGQTLYRSGGGEARTVWLNYRDEAGRILGVTTTREIAPSGQSTTSYTTHDIDSEGIELYTAKNGIEFATMTESDDTGENHADIAICTQGEYEYAFVFVGFGQEEREELLSTIVLP